MKLKRTRKTSPLGLLVELVGFILLFIFPLGTIAGIILLVIGGRMSLQIVCPNCRNPIASKDVRICPTCKSLAT